MSKVSVIVPNYNHAPYLRQRLDSIFNQTFQDFEVIILDDCSTDNSKEIIEQYRSNPKVSHIVYNKTNSGSPFKQWAKGFELAQGEYIWIAESDDWAEPDFLKECISVIESDSNISMTFTNSNVVHQCSINKSSNESHSYIIDGKDFIQSKMVFTNSVCNASAVLINRSKLSDTPPLYKELSGSGDYLLWINLCQQGKIAFINKTLNNFRQHETNTTSKRISSGTTFLEGHFIYEYMKKNGFIPPFAQIYVSLFWTSRIKELQSRHTFKANCDVKKLLSLWKEDSKGFLKNVTCCYLLLLLIRISPFSNYFYKKYKWMTYFQKLSTVELLWKILHLPNTNLKKIIQ